MKAHNSDNSPRPEAIQRLYEVFARYPARPDMLTCEHCATKRDIEYLTATPVGELSEGALNFYIQHAIETVGEVVDFKHFLPRIFEAMLWNDGSVDVEIVVGKLDHGHWRSWPAEEQEAISAFFFAWWKHLLSQVPEGQEAESCLCAIAQTQEDIARHLDYWRGCDGPEAVRHLAAVISWNYGALMESRPLTRPWWSERPSQMAQLRDWLLSPATGETLNQAFFTYAEQPFAKQLSNAAQQFEWIQKALAE